MGELLAEVMRTERGVPLSADGPFRGPLPSGAPGIFADTVARLGHRAGIVSGVGDDAFGTMILERLRDDGVDVEHVLVVPGRTTGTAFIGYDDLGQRSYVFHWAGTPAVMAPAPPATIADGARFFHVMGCSLLPDAAFAERIVATARRFRDAGATITFDPNIRAELLAGRAMADIVAPVLELTSLLLPGERELLELAGGDDLDTAAEHLLGAYDLRAVVVKRGAAGAIVYEPGRRTEVPAIAVEEVDPTGAGDVFDAAVVCALVEGRSIVEAVRDGVAAGALAATGFGPMEGPVDRSAIRALRDGRRHR